MLIKKDPETKNRYLFAGHRWIRDFTSHVKPVDINQFGSQDRELIVRNELSNRSNGLINIANRDFTFSKIAIVSDGYLFESRHKLLLNLPKDVAIFAVNKSLAKWTLVRQSETRAINLYVANNPYPECQKFLPKRTQYYPACVASTRTCSEFCRDYKGQVYTYEPTPGREFGFAHRALYHIDDYRNPICAAIGLAYRFNVTKLMLMFCDNSFDQERPDSIRLENGLYTYPQHLISQEIIDANLYWLTHQQDFEVKVADFSMGKEYKNASYIRDDNEAISFFEEEQ